MAIPLASLVERIDIKLGLGRHLAQGGDFVGADRLWQHLLCRLAEQA